MKLTQGIAFALIPSLVIAPCVRAAEAAPISGGFVNENTDALLSEGSTHALTATQYCALAVGLAESGKPDAAIVTAKLGLGVASNNREKAALMATLALIYGSKKDFKQAAEAAQLGQEYLPNDPRLASLRVVYYELADDGVAFLAAKSHLMRLDPGFNRKPVFSISADDVKVVVVGLVEVYVAVKTLWENLSPEFKEEIRAMIGKIEEDAPSAEN
jgi:hypothetical protein